MEKTDFTKLADQRPNYFPGQYLLEEDFELQHKYLSDRQRYYNHSLHVSGIIEGLEVEVIADENQVKIGKGTAIDREGNLIVLRADKDFSDFQSLNEGELYIEYSEEKQVKQQENIADSYTRLQEEPTLGFADKTPDNCVKLAKLLTISENNITLDPNVREYSGLSLPNSNSKALTLRSGGDAKPNLAVLTGSLKVDQSLEVAENAVINGSLTVTESLKLKEGLAINGFSNDSLGDSESILPTEKVVKTYIQQQIATLQESKVNRSGYDILTGSLTIKEGIISASKGFSLISVDKMNTEVDDKSYSKADRQFNKEEVMDKRKEYEQQIQDRYQQVIKESIKLLDIERGTFVRVEVQLPKLEIKEKNDKITTRGAYGKRETHILRLYVSPTQEILRRHFDIFRDFGNKYHYLELKSYSSPDT